MNLYEITTGREGVSYERCYVWAEDEFAASAAYVAKYDLGEKSDTVNHSIKFLFSAEAEPFCTELSTEGWEA